MNQRRIIAHRNARFTVTCALIFTVVFAPVSLAQPEQPSATSTETTTLVAVQGRQIPGGCHYEGKTVVHPGQIGIRQDELWQDPATCTMTMQQTTLVDPSVDRVPNGSASLRDAARASARTGRGNAVGTASTIHSIGYSRTWLEDPVFVPVTQVKNTIDWNWDGASIVGTSNCIGEYAWFWFTGWELHENDLTCLPNGIFTEINTSSFVHFKNGAFCLATDTHAYFDRNNAIGQADGTLVGIWTVIKTGSCQGLLSIHNTTERTLN